ncbi:MAG: hypothetical protein MR625_08140 [Clostridium sp.]|nr:hypothetical protein [Clostridium sp.]
MDFKNIKDIDNLIQVIKTNEIAIYGTGYVAGELYKALLWNNLINQLKFFITTQGGDKYKGYKVLAADNDRIKEVLILISVHESIKDEIIRTLEQKGCWKYIWINPEKLYSLMLGKPVKKNVMVPVKDIWIHNKDNYAIEVRYLAIENYLGLNSYGAEIYKKAISQFSNAYTAEKRLKQFYLLIENWIHNGYNNTPSYIMDDYEYIDGTHRITLAIYFNRENINCNIFSTDKAKQFIHNSKARLTKEEAIRWFSNKDLELIEAVNKKIDKQYSIVPEH